MLNEIGYDKSSTLSEKSSQPFKPNGFELNCVLTGDARKILPGLPPSIFDLSFWSPPYFVGKSYEKHLDFNGWKKLVKSVISAHSHIMKPGGFIVVNIADILCFADPSIPRFQADNLKGKKSKITRDNIIEAKIKNPNATRFELAKFLGCSEQTIQRRLEGNNVRGGKSDPATKIMLTGSMLNDWAEQAGLYLYDQRIWHKDPCWANSRWHSVSYKAVDEFEHLYIFWKPGPTIFDRGRLSKEEWSDWGSRGVWKIPSVRANHRHEAEFPEQLAERVIRLYSPVGGTIIDPFLGSGTTVAIAKKLKRKWLGIELNKTFSEMARSRIDEFR